MAEVTWPAATTRPVVLLGDPVAHSLSPLLHNTAFRALGLDLVYLALRVPGERFAEVVAALGAAGCVGANVTVPHKLAAHAACDQVTAVARATGAVNTLWWQGGLLHGDNTDVTGLRRLLAREDRDGPLAVLGTGGAARAVVVAAGERPVTVIGRDADAADVVAGLAATGRGLHLDDEVAVAAAVRDAATLVNATPLGMHGEPLPDVLMAPATSQVVHDLVYVHGTTPWVAAARAVGARTLDGRALLAAQAEDAFVRWVGRRPPAGLYEQLLAGAG